VIRKILESARLARRLRANREVWERFSLRREDLATLFNIWWPISAVMYFVQGISWINCLTDSPDVGERFQLVGFSCFLTWFGVSQYLESFSAFYMVFHTLSSSSGRVLRFLCSVGPLFCSFLLLGICLFWTAEIFATPAGAASVLFAVMNGDLVHDGFKAVGKSGGAFAHIYIYVFSCIFMYVVLKVNVFLVADAYQQHHTEPQLHAIKHKHGYMNQRFFGDRASLIQEAVAAIELRQGLAATEQSGNAVLVTEHLHSDVRQSSTAGLSLGSTIFSISPPLLPPSDGAAASSGELCTSGEDLRPLLAEVQAAVMRLQKARLPSCSATHGRQLDTALSELGTATERSAVAIQRFYQQHRPD